MAGLPSQIVLDIRASIPRTAIYPQPMFRFESHPARLSGYKSHSCQRFCSLPGWAGYGLHEEGIRSVGS